MIRARDGSQIFRLPCCRFRVSVWLWKPLLLGGDSRSASSGSKQSTCLSSWSLRRTDLRHLLHRASQAQSEKVLLMQNKAGQLFVQCVVFYAQEVLSKEACKIWLYRIKPSVTHEPFKSRVPKHEKLVSEFSQVNSAINPTQIRWKPVDIPDVPTDFVDGLYSVCGAGSSFLRHGFAIHMYTANKSMENSAFCNADGDFLIVPQSGRLWVTTECGKLQVSPGEIVILPQGFRFAIDLPDGPSRGYVAEVFGTHFQLPDLGPIGANGLASPKDFLVPKASFEQESRPGYTIIQKFGGELFTARQDFSPFNVVAWHGNYVPYKYDLSKFCPYNTVLVDHGDPSINTVLTAPTDKPGVALLDFVIFPPRWLVAEHTFRPPYYHRNCMSEFMGLIHGGYEAKADGFLPGGASLHSCMTPHGPDTKTYEATIAGGNNVGPHRIKDTMAFMFESCLMPRICPWALESSYVDHDYYQCWIGLRSHFNENTDLENGHEIEE